MLPLTNVKSGLRGWQMLWDNLIGYLISLASVGELLGVDETTTK